MDDMYSQSKMLHTFIGIVKRKILIIYDTLDGLKKI